MYGELMAGYLFLSSCNFVPDNVLELTLFKVANVDLGFHLDDSDLQLRLAHLKAVKADWSLLR